MKGDDYRSETSKRETASGSVAPTSVVSLGDIGEEHWFKSHWRPAAAWTYLAICLFDFMLAPIFFGWFSWMTKSAAIVWAPLTVQGGSIFHVSFGAIIGVYVWGRTKEKEASVENVRTLSKD